MAASLPDGKAVVAVETFGPPTVENREIQGPVEDGLLPRWSRRLPAAVADCSARRRRFLNHVAADVDVVVFDEGDPIGETRVVAEVGDPLDQFLPRLVRRMGLAREDQLERALGDR